MVETPNGERERWVAYRIRRGRDEWSCDGVLQRGYEGGSPLRRAGPSTARTRIAYQNEGARPLLLPLFVAPMGKSQTDWGGPSRIKVTVLSPLFILCPKGEPVAVISYALRVQE